MRLLFSGKMICSESTLKRLILVADEIGFMDHPATMLGNWGTIGTPSPVRQFASMQEPVILSVHSQPPGVDQELYRRYVKTDLCNPEFARVFLAGLRGDAVFADKFLQPNGNYRSGTGTEVRKALVADESLHKAALSKPLDVSKFFQIDSPDGRRETLKMLLADASIQVTNALIISEDTGMAPVTDDAYFAQLLALRSSTSPYLGDVQGSAVSLAVEVSRAVVPEEALEKLTISDLLEYRETTKEAYTAWAVEMERLGAMLSQLSPTEATKEIPRIVATDVAPRILQYRNDMISARDKLFGDMIKQIAKWEVASLSLAYLADISPAAAIVFFASALIPAIPGVVDYFQRRREIARSNSLTYLIGLKTQTVL